jgi:DNA (cytosine-5)-methyltransferase 1
MPDASAMKYLSVCSGIEAADGPRYKALGNSWAVPVVRWIGERIQAVDEIQRGAA